MTVAYTRTYSNKQQIKNQQSIIDRFVKEKNITVNKWYLESSSTSGKNKLEYIINGLKAGDTLVVSDLTRLSRKLMEIMHLIMLCLRRRITLCCIRENYIFEDNNDSQSMALAFTLAIDMERKLISSRTKEALATSKGKGVILGRPKGSIRTKHLHIHKDKISKEIKEEKATYTELAQYYKVSLSSFKRFIKEHITR